MLLNIPLDICSPDWDDFGFNRKRACSSRGTDPGTVLADDKKGVVEEKQYGQKMELAQGGRGSC